MDLLYQELEKWSVSGKRAFFWWRDDDARSASLALGQLCELSNVFQIPLALAVIPSGVHPSLVELLSSQPRVTVLQHGYAHINYASPGEKKQELGSHRSCDVITRELKEGYKRLERQFASTFFPVLVPPWNRISPTLLDQLSGLDYVGVSVFNCREKAELSPGLRVVNTHIDIINWKEGKKFAGETIIANQLVHHLREKRSGRCDPSEPTGILTHHLVHDQSSISFLYRLIATLCEHPAVEWINVRAAFQPR